jgi:hypothetical protein
MIIRRVSRVTSFSLEQPMDQPTTPAERPNEQRPTVSEAMIAAPGATPARHTGGFIARGAGVGLARQWRTFNLIANVVMLAAIPAVWL